MSLMVDLSRVPAGCPWNLFHDGDQFTAEVWPCHQAWVDDHEPIECSATTPQAALDLALEELTAHGVYPDRPALPAAAPDDAGEVL